MCDVLELTEIRFTVARCEDVETGLLGWITCVLNGMIRIESIALRRTEDGRQALSFPVRVDRHGRQHLIIRPVDDRARREIEVQVFAALGMTQSVPAFGDQGDQS